MYSILVVEDDAAISKGLTRGLCCEGFGAIPVRTGEQALERLAAERFDIVLLDIRLPGVDGLEVLRRLRKRGDTVPVIMVTARDEEIDKVLGLESGADDYIVKPFGFRELVSRIHALLRRSLGEFSRGSTGADVKFFGDIRVDTGSLRVFRDNSHILLTPTELKLLLFFLDNPGVHASRQKIIEHVWGYGYVLEDERTVDVHIRHLREKIEPDPSHPRYIRTVRGFGYRFDPGDDGKIKKP